MKKITLLIAIFFSLPLFAQHTKQPQSEKERFEELLQTRQAIKAYVSKNLNAYKLTDEKTYEVTAFYQDKTTLEGLSQILDDAKKAELQKLYFEQHPETKDFLNSFAPPTDVYREVQTSLPPPTNLNKSAEVTCASSVVPPAILNGVVITESYTGNVTTHSSAYTSCGNVTTPANSKKLGQDGAFTYTMYFNPPVNDLVIVLTGTGHFSDEVFTFTSSAGNPTISTITSCFTSISASGNVITSGSGAPSTGGGGIFTITAPNSFSSLTISGPGEPTGGSILSICSSSVVICNAGTNSPALTATTITNDCPATTVNLNTITATNTPASSGVYMTWHTGTPATNGNKITTAQAAARTAGPSYYATFYDSTNICYSNTTAVNSYLSECDSCDSCCPNHQILTQTVNNNMTHKRQAKITLTAKNTVNNGGMAVYHSETVILKPPFVSISGSKLRAYPEGCSSTYQEKTADSNIQETSTAFDQIALEKIDTKNNEIKILPNPSNGIFKIDLSAMSEGKITITDLYGTIVYESSFKNEKVLEVDIREKNKGIYIVHITSEENHYTNKIIKN